MTTKKIISFLSCIILLLATSLTSFAGYLVQWQIDSANNLAEKKIINDHSKDPENYNLNDNVLRQEIAAVARWVYEVWQWKNILDLKKSTCDSIFSDVSSTTPNTWACYSIEALVDNDLISANATFRPEDKITKAETIGMLIKAIWFDYEYDTTSSKNWQEQIVDFAVQKWVIEMFTDYNEEATRWWVFLVADTTIKKDEEEKRIKKQELEEKEKWIYSDGVRIN